MIHGLYPLSFVRDLASHHRPDTWGDGSGIMVSPGDRGSMDGVCRGNSLGLAEAWWYTDNKRRLFMIPRNNGYYQGMPGATMQESTTIHQTECHDDDVSEVLKQICNDTEELVTLAGETLEAMQATRRNMRSVIYAMEEPDGVKEERIRKARLHSSVSV